MMEAPEQLRCWPTNLKTAKEGISMQVNEKDKKVIIRGWNEIANQFAKYYQDLYDAAENLVNKDKLMQFFQKAELT